MHIVPSFLLSLDLPYNLSKTIWVKVFYGCRGYKDIKERVYAGSRGATSGLMYGRIFK